VSVIADKNKKNKANKPSASTSSSSTATSKTSNEKQCNSNSDVSSPSNNSTKNLSLSLSNIEKKSEKTSDDADDAATKSNKSQANNNNQIGKKRSSTTSSSSSVSSNSTIASSSNDPTLAKDLNESNNLTIKKLDPTTTTTTTTTTSTDMVEKLTTAKLTLKTRNSDSVSSNCSTYSIKRPSIDEQMLIGGGMDNKITPEQKLEETPVVATAAPIETKIEPNMDSLLSIKEEIMDFEPSSNIVITTNVISSNTPMPDQSFSSLVETKKDETSKNEECEAVSSSKTTTTTTTKVSSKVTLKRNSAKNKKEDIACVTSSTVVITTNEEVVTKNSSKKLNDEKPVEQTLDNLSEKKIEITRKSNEKPNETTLGKQEASLTSNEIKKLDETTKKVVEVSMDQENLNIPIKKPAESKVLSELTNEATSIVQAIPNDEHVLAISKKTDNVPVNTIPESKYSFNLIGNFS
jgi:hypothetical protein